MRSKDMAPKNMTPTRKRPLAQGKGTSKPAVVASVRESTPATPAALLSEVRALILATRQTVAQGVNSALVLLYWHIGQRIRSDMLKSKRAAYGAEILPTLSAKLVPAQSPLNFGARTCSGP